MEIKSSNPKAFAKLKAALKDLDGYETKVGWFESAVYESGRPVAAVAAGNEFGIPDRSIPARPFMRPTVDESTSQWTETATRMSTRVLEGKMSAEKAMDVLGQQAEANIAKTITQVLTPPLSPITLGARKYRQQGKEVTGATIGEIARKLKEGKLDVSGVSTKPLQDTGVMLDTLTHVTERA